MSVEFELEVHDFLMDKSVAFDIDAYTHEAFICMYDVDHDGHGAGCTFTGDQVRQLRRFLEWTYPASEDPEHGPDPWER